jgi:hypothetical protein
MTSNAQLTLNLSIVLLVPGFWCLSPFPSPSGWCSCLAPTPRTSRSSSKTRTRSAGSSGRPIKKQLEIVKTLRIGSRFGGIYSGSSPFHNMRKKRFYSCLCGVFVSLQYRVPRVQIHVQLCWTGTHTQQMAILSLCCRIVGKFTEDISKKAALEGADTFGFKHAPSQSFFGCVLPGGITLRPVSFRPLIHFVPGHFVPHDFVPWSFCPLELNLQNFMPREKDLFKM